MPRHCRPTCPPRASAQGGCAVGSRAWLDLRTERGSQLWVRTTDRALLGSKFRVWTVLSVLSFP